MQRFAQLFDDIDRTTSTNAKVAAMGAYFRQRAAGGCRVGRLLPDRPPAQAPAARAAAIRDWTLAATGLAAWMLDECYVGRRRRRRDGGARSSISCPPTPADDLPLASWLEERILPLRRLDPAAQQARATPWFRRARSAAAVHPAQAPHRRAARRRLADARRARARRSRGASSRPAIAARLMGEWTPTAAWFASAAVDRNARTTTARARIRSSWPRRSRTQPATLGDPGALAGRVEMGRHPRAADSAGRRGAPVVARRGAHHAPLPGDRRGGVAAAGRHRARRRGAGVSRRPAAAVLRSAAADRPAEAGRAAGARSAGRVHGLRRARARRRATCAPRPLARAASPRSSRSSACDDGAAGVGRPAASPTSPPPRGTSWPKLRGDSRARGVEGLMLKRLDSTVRRRPQARRLVEVEDRSVQRRRRADLRAAGQRPAREPADRLHVRRLGRRRARAVREGLLRAVERGDRRARSLDPAAHARALRTGPSRRARPGLRARIRGDRPLDAPPVRHRGAVPADAAMAQGQAGGRGRHARQRPPAPGPGPHRIPARARSDSEG